MRRVNVTEVLSRAEQGRTQPFLCRCDDGASYFVKGASAGPHGLVAEVICAQLAHAIGLPVPEAVIADVSEDLVYEAKAVGIPLDELRAGPAFGSKVVQASEFNFSQRKLVPQQLAEQVVVFDWWVRNEDRTLSALGGNVNLLWEIQPNEGLVVIDHNLAFTEFDPTNFLETHIFADEFVRVATDFDLMAAWVERFGAALQNWDAICAVIPHEWNFIDAEQTLPSNVNLDSLRLTLEACSQKEFWILP